MEQRWRDGIGPTGPSGPSPDFPEAFRRWRQARRQDPRWGLLAVAVTSVTNFTTLMVTASVWTFLWVTLAGSGLSLIAHILIKRWQRSQPPGALPWWLQPISRRERAALIGTSCVTLAAFLLLIFVMPDPSYWTVGVFIGGWGLYGVSVVLLYLRQRNRP